MENIDFISCKFIEFFGSRLSSRSNCLEIYIKLSIFYKNYKIKLLRDEKSVMLYFTEAIVLQVSSPDVDVLAWYGGEERGDIIIFYAFIKKPRVGANEVINEVMKCVKLTGESVLPG